MEDALSPTLEQLRRDTYEPPQVDQQTNRRAWRKVTVFENLHHRGEIEFYQLRAAEKLEMHWHGAQGACVRFSEDSGAHNDESEFPRTWHAQKLAQAQAQVRPREWLALQDIILGAALEDVGRKWRAVGRREIARAQALVLVFEGLEVLGNYWGLTNEKRRPSRAAS